MTTPAPNARIVDPDETLKLPRSVASTELTETMSDHLQRLVDDHEAAADQPLILDPGPPPFRVTLSDLRETAKAQSDALERIVEIVRRAEEDKAAVNPNLQADIIVDERRRITEQAMAQAAGFFREMAGRSLKAQASEEFYAPAVVRQRARFDGSEQAHHTAVSAWVARLSAAPGVALIRFAREAVADGNVALASLVLENMQGREGEVSDTVRHAVEGALATLELPESREGLDLIATIVSNEKKAGIEILRLDSTRLDALSKSGRAKITVGMNERGRRGRGALIK